MNVKLLAAAVAIASAVALTGGMAVGQWRAEAACAADKEALHQRVGDLVAEKHALELAIAEVNRAADVAAAETRAADEARRAAEKHAEDLAAFSQSRLDKLQRSFDSATSCDEVLRSYWEIRQ